MPGNRRGGASRTALLAAGRAAFSAQRYEEVSVVEVARSIGAAAGSVSYHFGGKRGYYLAVLEQAADDFWSQLTQMRGPGVERLGRGMDMFLDMAEQEPEAFEALIANAADAEVRQIHDRHRRRLARALAIEITGSESTPVLQTALAGCLSLIEGTVLHWIHTEAISRRQLRELLMASVYSTVFSAISVDPQIELSQRALEALMAGSQGRDLFTSESTKSKG